MQEFNPKGEVNVQTVEISVSGTHFRGKGYVLRVDGRPVAVADFEKIPSEPIIADNGVIADGETVGRVNVFPGACGKLRRPGHLHVLWLKDGELRRACVDATPPNPACADLWKKRYAEFAALPHLFLE